jgi:NAD(P)-dependent dehydrogenase (short-subunit alcohol dehydrogenase family)
MLLEGNKVVVIGGSSGIGLAIARQARTQGASLVIVGRDPVKRTSA